MTIFQQLRERADQAGTPLLVIGGVAVNFYGVARETADLDILIRESDKQAWSDFLLGKGYSLVKGAGAFLQFSAPEKGQWPLDLMLLKASTFEPMDAASIGTKMFGTSIRVPSLNHLLALKLHALAHSHVGRFMKDYLDVENLVKVNGLDIASEEVKSLVFKYGSAEVYSGEHSENRTGANDEEKLEFPVEPDFISELPKVDFQAMLRRIEANLAERNSRPGELERRLNSKIDVEFVL